MDKPVSNTSADSALLKKAGSPETLIPEYSDDEVRHLGALQIKLEPARNLRNTNHDEFDGMTFTEQWQAEEKSANTFIAPKINAEDTNFVAGSQAKRLPDSFQINFQIGCYQRSEKKKLNCYGADIEKNGVAAPKCLVTNQNQAIPYEGEAQIHGKSRTLTIRKFKTQSFTIQDLTGIGTTTPEVATTSRPPIIDRRNILISRGTDIVLRLNSKTKNRLQKPGNRIQASQAG